LGQSGAGSRILVAARVLPKFPVAPGLEFTRATALLLLLIDAALGLLL
jgi:hypothetical protein